MQAADLYMFLKQIGADLDNYLGPYYKEVIDILKQAIGSLSQIDSAICSGVELLDDIDSSLRNIATSLDDIAHRRNQ